VRLPKELEQYMRALEDDEFFVTTWDGSIGKIYPRSIWEENRKVLARNARIAIDLGRYVDHYGSLATIDNQGRILVSPQLRRKLGIENQPVFLRYDNENIEIYSEAALNASLERAEAAGADVLAQLYEDGLK